MLWSFEAKHWVVTSSACWFRKCWRVDSVQPKLGLHWVLSFCPQTTWVVQVMTVRCSNYCFSTTMVWLCIYQMWVTFVVLRKPVVQKHGITNPEGQLWLIPAGWSRSSVGNFCCEPSVLWVTSEADAQSSVQEEVWPAARHHTWLQVIKFSLLIENCFLGTTDLIRHLK